MAATAAFIGAIANTLRLELVDFTHMPPAAAAFIGALTAGLLASFIKKSNGYPRISLTVPSIVIMVPGLYLYRAIYNFGIMSLTDAVSWFTSAIMIIVMLPLGLIFAESDRSYVSVLYVKSLILKSSVVNRHYRFFRTDEQSVSGTDKKAGTNQNAAGNLK